MVYEWDPVRARRARMIKLASVTAWAISVIGVPAAIVIATMPK